MHDNFNDSLNKSLDTGFLAKQRQIDVLSGDISISKDNISGFEENKNFLHNKL